MCAEVQQLLGPKVFISDRLSFEPRFGMRANFSSVDYFSNDDKFIIPDYEFMRLHFLSHITFRLYF